MNRRRECPDCGTSLGDQFADGLCPACLLRLGLGRRRLPIRVVSPLGRGPFGPTVLAATTGAERRLVTVKYLEPGAGGDVDAGRFEAVLERLVGLSHPHVVPVVDGEIPDEGLPYVVSAYIPGTTIDRYCQRQGVALWQRLLLVASVARAAGEAHRFGLVHGHLAEPNVLVAVRAGGPIPQVRDFAIRTLVGLDSRPADDVASLGLLLQRLAGSLPPQLLAVGDIIRRAIGAAGAGQYRSPDDLAGDLERVVGESPTLPGP